MVRLQLGICGSSSTMERGLRKKRLVYFFKSDLCTTQVFWIAISVLSSAAFLVIKHFFAGSPVCGAGVLASSGLLC